MDARWSDEVERNDNIDDENYHSREVYAKFGLAVYFAQVLEAGVVNLLTVAQVFAKKAGTRDEFTALMEGYFRRTLGALRKEWAPYLGEDANLLSDLGRAVGQRNWLIHHYWYHRVGLTTSVRGRSLETA